jgi:hypothetical protein
MRTALFAGRLCPYDGSAQESGGVSNAPGFCPKLLPPPDRREHRSRRLLTALARLPVNSR